MRRTIFGPACALALCAGLAAGGCDTLRPSTRREPPPPIDEAVEPADGDGSDRIEAVTSDGRPSNAPFFKNNRLKGGLSDQARDIESSLGVR
ncbi:hypothetical protein [Paludisphaera sp.]|uniref:hypothetical protein n=1 Tax=Paludisphaera sp. TaxID=2017432 RepID=UPI00301C7062